jgi:hypothetical protein
MAMPKVKKKKPRAAPRIQRGAKLKEPSWEGWEEWTGEQIHRHRRNTHSWYYEHFKPADLYGNVPVWMADNGYSKDEIKSVKNAPNSALSITAGIVARMDIKGAPRLNKKEAEHWASLPGTSGELTCGVERFLKEKVTDAIKIGSQIVEQKQEVEKVEGKKYVPTIQERIRDQAIAMSEGIDEWLEGWIENPKSFDPNGFDLKAYLKKVQPTQAHARKMRTMWEMELTDFDDLERMPTKGQLAKMSELDADLWAQLKEGYSHLKKADIAKKRKAVDAINAELDFIIDQAKATRKPRKPKQRSAGKVVEKLKFSKADPKYSLASIDPTLIVGANELWVFNVKTRKLGKYIASNIDPKGLARDGTGLSVKGTTIIGFDENTSIQKTLRKPADQLKEFKNSGKVALRKFMDEIATTDTKLNGRCNPDTVLLKVV